MGLRWRWERYWPLVPTSSTAIQSQYAILGVWYLERGLPLVDLKLTTSAKQILLKTLWIIHWQHCFHWTLIYPMKNTLDINIPNNLNAQQTDAQLNNIITLEPFREDEKWRRTWRREKKKWLMNKKKKINRLINCKCSLAKMKWNFQLTMFLHFL